MSDTALTWIIVLGGVVAAQLPYLTATALAAAPFFRIKTISLGVGPQLVKFRVKDTTVRIALYLPSSYVDFYQSGDDTERAQFDTGAWWQRLICVLAGPFAMIGTAALVLGTDTIGPALAPFFAVEFMITHPTAPIEVTNVIAPVVREHGMLHAMAQAAAFAGGIQFLPLSFLSGGMTILALAQAFHGQPLPMSMMDPLHKLSVVVGLVLFALAVIAIAR